jgi:hypothetical protein
VHDVGREKPSKAGMLVAPGLLSSQFRVSRSFVRAWATVATIMALACFAFVQPMPEHVDGERVASQQTPLLESGPDQVSPAAPFVDSIMTGKTFTPYLTIDSRPPLHHGGSRLLAQVQASTDVRGPTLEPPTRPG